MKRSKLRKPRSASKGRRRRQNKNNNNGPCIAAVYGPEFDTLRNKALVPGIVLNINSLLPVRDSCSVKSTCKEWHHLMPRKVVMFAKAWRGSGDYADKDKLFIS